MIYNRLSTVLAQILILGAELNLAPQFDQGSTGKHTASVEVY